MEQLFFPVTQKKASQAGIGRSSDANKNALFPTQLRNLRKEKGVSQDELSKILGVSKSTVGLWETGDTLPDARSLHDLAVYYEVSADYLLGLSDIKSYNAHPRIACELTGLSEEAFNRIWSITSHSSKSRNDALRQAMNAFLSNENFARLIAELKSCITYSRNIEHRLSSIANDNKYTEQGIPTDAIELLNYIKDKWSYEWESGERFYDFSDFSITVKAEQERGYSLFLCQNLFLKIVNEISEDIIRRKA